MRARLNRHRSCRPRRFRRLLTLGACAGTFLAQLAGWEAASAGGCWDAAVPNGERPSCSFTCDWGDRVAIKVVQEDKAYADGRGRCGIALVPCVKPKAERMKVCRSPKSSITDNTEGTCRGGPPATELTVYVECTTFRIGAEPSFRPLACVLAPGDGAGTSSGMLALTNDAFQGGGADPLGLLDVETGSFTFSGEATCAGTDIVGATVALTMSGTYESLVCGTVDLLGSATLTAPGISLSSEVAMTFVSGNGAILFSEIAGTLNGNPVDYGSADGLAGLRPAAGNCVNLDMTQFVLEAAFASEPAGSVDA